MMKNMGQIMKQVQEAQRSLAKLQEEEAIGQSGGGMVQATVSGKGELRKLQIDPAVIDPAEKEMLEDLVVAAFNDAKKKIDQKIADETQKMMGGLPLPPGFQLPI